MPDVNPVVQPNTPVNTANTAQITNLSPTAAQPMQILICMPTQAYFLSGIRDFTLNLIKNMTDFNEKWAYRFQSIVDELCNNAIEHGSKEGETIKITFENLTKNYLQITVEDTGTGKSQMNAEEIKKLVEERRKQTGISTLIRGRGLPKIVAEWADELEFQNTEKGGILVRVRKYIQNSNLTAANPTPASDNPNHIVLN
jgi:anti-sigma regulatory factor (Ser/Thr protein kinase)